MPFHETDRFLLVAVCLGLCASYIIVPRVLQDFKDAAASPSPESSRKDKRLDRDAEKELRLDTLNNLASGHIYELRHSAIKVVASRTVKSSTRKLLLRDLASEEEEIRENAINGLWLLIYLPYSGDRELPSYFLDYQAFSALITALVNLLPLHKRFEEYDNNEDTGSKPKLPPSPIRPSHRPAHEVSLVIMLTYLLQYRKLGMVGYNKLQERSLKTALSAGLVSRWLTNYPFPCALPENSGFNFKKDDVAGLFDMNAWASDDPLMYEIMKILTRSTEGVKRLQEAGLGPRSYPERVVWRPYYHTYQASVAPSEVDQAGPGEERTRARPRSAERSQEEESLRRRHREAIVVAERGVPLGPENILQRENSRVPLAPLATTTDEETISNTIEDEFNLEQS